MRHFLRKLMSAIFGSSYTSVKNLFSGNRRIVKGNGNKILVKGRLNKVKIKIKGNNNTITINSGAYLLNTLILIQGNGHQLEIGKNCIFKGGELWMENENCKLVLGDGTTVVQAHLAVTEPHRKIIIGKNCMFSREIEFRTGDSHSIIDIRTGQRINEAKDVIIGDHVWIGARVIVLKGVTVGDNCILGTGSIITKSIPPNTIAAGVPARVLRENVSWQRERIVGKKQLDLSHE